MRVTLVPCPNTTQSARAKRSRRSTSEATRSCQRREHGDSLEPCEKPPPKRRSRRQRQPPAQQRLCATQRYGALPPFRPPAPLLVRRSERRHLPYRRRATDRRVSRSALCACVAVLIFRGAAPFASRFRRRCRYPCSPAIATRIAFPYPNSLLALEPPR